MIYLVAKISRRGLVASMWLLSFGTMESVRRFALSQNNKLNHDLERPHSTCLRLIDRRGTGIVAGEWLSLVIGVVVQVT